jgi:hypothetical protein
MRDRFVHIGRLQIAAKSRKPGVVEAYMKVGKTVEIGGQPFVQLSDADYQAIRAQFALAPSSIPVGQDSVAPSKKSALATPKTRPPIVQTRKKLGLGDMVAKIATPIAKALNMDCIDKATGQLKPESPCAQRKAALNKIRI